jgi:hypothetical protein
MSVRSIVGLLGALSCALAWAPAAAQDAYKCTRGRDVTYSQQPCHGRVINTREASVPAKPNPKGVDLRRVEQNRILAQTLHRRPGETVAQFDTRRRRASMLAEDRQECARLEKRIPVERARMDHPDEEVIDDAQAALVQSRKRFAEMRC